MLPGQAKNSAAQRPVQAHATLQMLTEAHPSEALEQGNSERTDGLLVRLDVGVWRRLQGPAPKLSLSPLTIKGTDRQKLPPFSPFFSPST
jgi:hypothetical protein